MKLLGLDPGLRTTGWGLIDVEANRLRHLANGAVATRRGDGLAERLLEIYEALLKVIDEYAPDAAAVEETFVARNPRSALRLGQARGVVLLAPASRGLPVAEYAPNLIKKTVVGTGHAGKAQIRMMVGHLLPGCSIEGEDAADALAVAICHAHHLQTNRIWSAALERAGAKEVTA
ncbi:MAG: crossover junction endodeoxyribonuclease RuvC [Proteobacteria bacterium]|nr:crossover junction endodeoxyribonuclease RuvC [Pseudomonadota bacterium]